MHDVLNLRNRRKSFRNDEKLRQNNKKPGFFDLYQQEALGKPFSLLSEFFALETKRVDSCMRLWGM